MEPEKFGRYEIKSEFGRGGMATVFHAYDPRFQRDIALKVLPQEFLHDPTFRARFEREAQTIAALEHPAIVPVYDFGEDHGQPYLVMRFLPGGTLTDRLEQGALPFDEVIRIITRLAPALSEAHQQGIIHRDLKPDNILFDQRNDPFITDFGIAKLSEGGGTITTGNVIIGTPAYMSPEQAQGEAVIDGRSDIYALGVILFQMLSGQLPFNAATPVGLVMKHISEPVPHILEINPKLPSICDTVIKRSMAKNPNHRYPTATDLAAALTTPTGGAPAIQSGVPGMVVVPVGSVPQGNDPLRQDVSEQEASDQRQSATPPPEARVSPAPAAPVEELRCPNCGASLPGDIAPGQPIECNSCGSRFIMTLPEPDKTIICPNCRTNNPETLSFCAGCGQRLKVDCVRCHTKNRIDATHCANCGTNLKSAQERRREMQAARLQAQKERDQTLAEKKARQEQEKIHRLLSDLDSPTQQDFAVYQLNQLGDKALKALIDALLTDPSPNIRNGSARALGQICEGHDVKALMKGRAARALIKALTDSKPTVRYYAAEALGKFTGQQGQLAVEPLGALLKDSHEEVRKQARASLQKIGGERAQEILNSAKGFMGWFKGS